MTARCTLKCILAGSISNIYELLVHTLLATNQLIKDLFHLITFKKGYTMIKDFKISSFSVMISARPQQFPLKSALHFPQME